MSTRAPFQVLIFPFRTDASGVRRYCIFRRKDAGYWQAIAGGGELGESPAEAAQREATEESGISPDGTLLRLDTTTSIPVAEINGFLWGPDIPIIPEYAFGFEADTTEIVLSKEHSEYQWVEYTNAIELLKWDSNKTALWELEYRITNGLTDRVM